MLRLGLIMIFFGLVGPAWAALPGGAELQRLHDVLNAPRAPLQLPEAPARLSPPDVSGPLDDQAADTFFTLTDVEITGTTLYPPHTFLQIFAGATGQQISVKDLYDLVAEITRIYRNDGYILSRAILPPQEIQQGRVRIQVIEGEIENVTLEGPHANSRLLNAFAQQVLGSVLHNDMLERALLLMNDVPGVTATSTLAPGHTPGTSHLIIHTAQQKVTGSAGISNWATRYMGPYNLELDGESNNIFTGLTGWHDGTRVRAIQSSNLRHLSYLDVVHTLPVWMEGTMLRLGGHYSQSEPGWTLSALDLQSETSGFSVELTHPFKRTRTQNLSGFLMFDWRDTTTNTGPFEMSADHIRALRTGISWDRVDDWQGLTTGRLELSHGLGAFGASKKGDPNLSRLRGTGSDYWRVKLDWARLQRLNKSWNFLLATTMQYATDPLLAGEEFNFGGENYGRGYGTSEITGDHGIAAKAELHINFPVGMKYLSHWQLFGFYDFGATWQRDIGASETNSADTLASYGWGIRSQLGPKLSLDFTMAKPLSGVAESGGEDEPNIYMRVRNQF